MVTVWNKWVQALIKTTKKEDITLAGLLTSDKQAFVYYYHLSRQDCAKLNLHPIEASWLAMDLIKQLIPDFYATNFLETKVQRNFSTYLKELYEQR